MFCGRCGAILPHPGGRGCPQRPSRLSRPSRSSRPSRESRPSRQAHNSRPKRESKSKSAKIADLPIWSVDSEAQGDKLTFVGAASETGLSAGIRKFKSAPEVFEFLLSLPRCILVSFSFGYDVTMILKPLSDTALDTLRRNGEVYYGEYVISHIPAKMFRVQNRRTGKSVTVWDIWGWVQKSFARMIAEWNLTTPEQQKEIEAMKSLRSDFKRISAARIERYCLLECELLSKWMRINLDLHKSAGIRLRTYCGGGSTASALLRANGYEPPPVPANVERIAEAAYYGGRSEISRIGPYEGEVYVSDINSAYPWALADMPDVSGPWKRKKRLDPGDWGFALVRWKMPESTVWGPFPLRWNKTERGRNSSLLYPTKGAGWYHTFEVSQSPDAEVIEAVVLEDPSARPFAWVRDMAALRLEYKAANDPRATVLKYGLNAMYGKLAQRTGKQQFRSVTLASAITSRVRSVLYGQARKFGHRIFMMSTDGVISSAPLNIREGQALGEWEITKHKRCFIAQSGVYWLDGKVRIRGFELRNIDPAKVESAYAADGIDGAVDVPTRRFIGYRSAMARNSYDIRGTWEDGVRTLSLSPYPRRRPSKRDKHGATLTLPARLAEWKESAALDALFFDPARVIDEEDQPEWAND